MEFLKQWENSEKGSGPFGTLTPDTDKSDMSITSSSSSSFSNDSLLQPHLSSINSSLSYIIHCLLSRPSSFIFSTYSITAILLLLPLCSFILYLGLQRQLQQRSSSSSSSAATMSHSDCFTYHMAVMELVGVLGLTLSLYGIFMEDLNIIWVSVSLIGISWYGGMLFHILTCVERYLAAVHPIIYLSLRKERGIRIRNITIGCLWLLCFVVACLSNMDNIVIVELFLLFFSLTITVFCSVSVLFILVRPRPGEQGGDRGRVDQSKQRAFYTIIAILGVLLLKSGWNLRLELQYTASTVHLEQILRLKVKTQREEAQTQIQIRLLAKTFKGPSSFIFIGYSITAILLLLPLCTFILYLGLQRRLQQRSSSSAATMSHSDCFTYHMAVIELIGVLGLTLSLCGIFMEDLNIMWLGFSLMVINWCGEVLFHILTCVERYLAAVHPIIYLSLRKERGIRIRNITIGCVWLLCFAWTCLSNMDSLLIIPDFCLLFSSLTITVFCSVSVLCVLIRPRPGEQGGDRGRVDQSKQRAFYTIIAILGVLLLRCGWNLVWAVAYVLKDKKDKHLHTGRLKLRADTEKKEDNPAA
ncbi:uncharacterized protein AKAME5_002476000, partial [Lates japonicus]